MTATPNSDTSSNKHDKSHPSLTLKRDIGLLGAAVLVLNGLIGAGIFALPAKMLAQLGSLSPWIFPLFGLLMLTIVWSFAELAARFPQTGGPVLYTKSAFGNLVSFQTGWLFYLARATAIAANAHVLTLYLSYLLPDAGLPNGLIVVTVCALLTLINYIGIKRSMQFLDGFTLVKISPILLLVGYGLTQADLSAFVIAPEQLQIDSLGASISSAALLTLYAFIGFETVVVTSGETKQPEKNLPKALTYTVIATSIFYCFVQLAYTGVMQGKVTEGAPLIAFARELAGQPAAIAIALAAIFSVTANVLANMISTSRLSFAMAEEGAIPGWFAHLHKRFATPDYSILFLGILAALLSLTGGFVWLVVVSVLSRMLVYFICIASLLKLRKTPNWPTAGSRTKRIVLALLPWLAFAIILAVIAQSSWQAWAMLAGEIVLGMAFFWWWSFSGGGARSRNSIQKPK